MNNPTDQKLQFRVLRRLFLFRVVDLDALSSSAAGDSSRLLGRFAALLVFVSMMLSIGLLGLNGADLTADARLALTLYTEHLLIATTMLAVGVFAVLSWDAMLPDRRDALVLGSLPVQPKTIALAKASATGTALALVVIMLNCATGLGWPVAFAMLTSASQSILGVIRWYAAYWFTMLAAAAFVYCGVLALQGVATQVLPRRAFLRASGLLQMGAFCLFLCAYFLEPAVSGPKMLSASENHRALFCVPTYWFLELFDQLNGSQHSVIKPLALRAWVGLTLAGLAAATLYILSHTRTVRKIVEEADITARGPGLVRLPRFGPQTPTAIGQFVVRSLGRSRQHRLIWAFYLGLGLAGTILMLQAARQIDGRAANTVWHQANAPVLASSILMLTLAIIGLRVVFAFPLETKANWVFRAAGIRGSPNISTAIRRAMLLIAVMPVWITTALACFRLWPWRQAAAHAAVLALLGSVIVDIALYGFRKIPFTCSYLPGKSAIHMIFVAAIGLMWLVAESAEVERQILQEPVGTLTMVALVAVAAIIVRWRVAMAPKSGDELHFEEEAVPAVMELGLFRDGAVLGAPTQEE
jgi:hypothetical protein